MPPKFARVLLIVPEFGLPLAPEIDAFYPLGYNILPLQGKVTRERIFSSIRDRKFDIIHYAGHSGVDGVRLSDDGSGHAVIMEAPVLVQLARAVEAQLVFLNGCSSIQVGQVLVDEHVPFVICTLDSIENTMARETAQLFYTSLTQTNDIRAAFNVSKPPVKGGYSILTNGSSDASLTPILERIAIFSTFMERNDREHSEICTLISANDAKHTRIMALLAKSRVWSIVIMLIGMIGVGVIVGLFGMIGRGALP